MVVAVAVQYGLILANGLAEPQAPAMALAAAVLGNVGLILSNRFFRQR